MKTVITLKISLPKEQAQTQFQQIASVVEAAVSNLPQGVSHDIRVHNEGTLEELLKEE